MMDADSQLPAIFRKRAIPFWIAGFVAACCTFQIFADVLRQDSLEEATVFISVNIEILVTMLTVTMGVTLLGLQFRAQSYTMIALIRYIKDRVVYGFISVFVVLIIFSMSSLIIPGIDQVRVAPFAFIGTSFSLVYLVGYVYYMVHEIQPTQMMKHIEKQIAGMGMSAMAGDEKKPHEIELFHVWEQIMLKAVDTDNFYVYRIGIRAIFDKLHDCLDKCEYSERDRIYTFFFQYISTVILSCVRENRERFVKVFMDVFRTTNEGIPDSDDEFSSRRMMMFHMWQHIMRESIQLGNIRMSNYGMSTITRVLDRYLEQYPEDSERTLTFFHMYMSRAVDFAITNNNTHYLFGYLEAFGTRNFPERRIAEERTPLHAWITIMEYAVTTGHINIFEYGIEKIFSVLRSVKPAANAARPMHEAVMRVVVKCRLDERYVRILMNAYSGLPEGQKPTRMWRHVLFDSVRSSSDVIFDLCISAIKDALSAPDAGFFSDFSRKMRENAELGRDMPEERITELVVRIDTYCPAFDNTPS